VQTPVEIYQTRQQSFDRQQREQLRASQRLSNYRLVVFLLGLVGGSLLYYYVNQASGIAGLLIALALFILLAVRHSRMRGEQQLSQAHCELNRRGLARLSGEWITFPDKGTEFLEEDHPYATDLDLFGQASFFQWINSAQTPLGRAALSEWLLRPPEELAEIRERQQAIQELAPHLDWRQRLQAEGMLAADQFAPVQPLLNWAKSSEPVLTAEIRLAVRLLPPLSILTTALYAWHLFPFWQVPALLAAMQALLLWLNNQQRTKVFTAVSRHAADLETYSRMLQQFAELAVSSSWLTAKQQQLKNKTGLSASQQIHRLSRIVDLIQNRRHMLFLPVNILTLWDYQCLIALEGWKQQSGKLLRTWLEVLGEVEALSSLANIHFDHPDWAMPQIMEPAPQRGDTGGLTARGMGHALLGAARVVNDFVLQAPSRIILITGSNMSGKSTFLRTVGSNLMLAYAGAPVCAADFRCSRLHLWSCMRVSDNLQQSVSSFYAELLRIKRIVAATKNDPPVCFLLDEIFKGTNSEDRHQGARALISQLQRDGAFGLVSTHDLELGRLEQDSRGRIKNFHFREYYENDEIHFDYKLRPGVSTTRNALHLIRLAGIELDTGF
jgi:DNA mismatch repair ATPase MutS